MIVDVEYKQNNLIVSIVDESGQIKLKYYPYKKPTKYIIASDSDQEKSGKYVSWSGNAVKQIYTKYPNKYSIYDFLDELPQEEQDILFKYNEPNIFFVDIENEVLNSGRPKAQLAEGAIQTISIVNKNKVLVIGTDPLTDKEISSIKNDINNQYGKKFERAWEFKYIRYKNEYEMLLNFFKAYVPRMPVITGWFFVEYDWVYLVNRARKLGVDPSEASFTRKLVSNFNDPLDYTEMPAHRIVVDYKELYKKWDTSIKVKESDALDFVSYKILGVKKVNYEGNLKILYETDFKKFVFYNAVDSLLVQLIHENMRYVDILYGISTLSRVTCTSALSTLAVTEGIFRKDLREKKNIVLCRVEHVDENASAVKGGWVKEPIKGMSSWTTCYDFESLYPRTMMQFNISADSYKGQRIKDTNFAMFNGHQVEIDPTDIITKNGSVFKNEQGIITKRLAEVFADRKKYKTLMQQKYIVLNDLKKELEELEKAA